MPAMIFQDIPEPEEEDLDTFNHQLYRYCVRKNIDPFDYFFDELPLLMATITMGGRMYKGYNINHKLRMQAEELGEPAESTEEIT